MQGGEDQVAGLGGGEGRLDGVQVPHLTDEDHIRVFPKDGAQAVGIAMGIGADLALVDDAFIRVVHIFDGVFQGNDVGVPCMVDAVQDGGQSCGFAGTGLAGDQHNAGPIVRKGGHHRGQIQLLQLGNSLCQQTDGGGETALLPEQIDSGTGPAGEALGQV